MSENVNKVASAGEVSKRYAVEQALAALGRESKPDEIKDFLRLHFGVEMTNEQISNTKSEVLRKARTQARDLFNGQGDEPTGEDYLLFRDVLRTGPKVSAETLGEFFQVLADRFGDGVPLPKVAKMAEFWRKAGE